MIVEIVFFPIPINNNSLLDSYNLLFYTKPLSAPHSTRLFTIKSPNVVQYWFIEDADFDFEPFSMCEVVKYVSQLNNFDHITYDDVLLKKNNIIDSIAAQPYTLR
jgi:hypothetical protein